MTAERAPHLVDNRFGWRLSLVRISEPGARGRPVLLVPGYGMNSFIFGFHPNGPSFVDTLAARGLEVWTMDFRGQGRSIRATGNNRYGMSELVNEDIAAAISHVLEHTRTGALALDVVGCSLGAALVFAHLALHPEVPIHAVVSMAGLVTWRGVHPAVRFAFVSPRLAGLMRMKNTRTLARLALPIVAKVAPRLLSVYLNEQSTDFSRAAHLVQTVEDPHPKINREIARWIHDGDLIMRGVNISQRLPSMRHPFFCVIANDDGIVLPATARHTFDLMGSTTKTLLAVGTPETTPIAHADLFVCRGAQERIFAPVGDFLITT